MSSKRLLAKVKFRPAPDYDGDPVFGHAYPNAITSKIEAANYHLPLFDVDRVGWHVLRSRTDGHSHIYVEQPITWEQYSTVIRALLEANLIDPRWAEATLRQGCATLRLPWMLDEELALVKEPLDIRHGDDIG